MSPGALQVASLEGQDGAVGRVQAPVCCRLLRDLGRDSPGPSDPRLQAGSPEGAVWERVPGPLGQ